MRDQEFVAALDTLAGELVRRADAYAGSDTGETCHLVLTNAATGLLIALNVMSKAKPSVIEAPATPGIPIGVADRAILSHGAI